MRTPDVRHRRARHGGSGSAGGVCVRMDQEGAAPTALTVKVTYFPQLQVPII
ncbi:hypothetical protein ABT294_46545 [Nonomuraea sp. NPDC000554]|uniref:hypothetical protein n=1 Tax=Nonomuraea sp. NPDC000554 TaxID=3154259 RepID=UPI003329E394